MAEPKQDTKPPSGSEIKPCTCKHKFQDDRYGKGMRVFNKAQGGYRCTVCGTKSSK